MLIALPKPIVLPPPMEMIESAFDDVAAWTARSVTSVGVHRRLTEYACHLAAKDILHLFRMSRLLRGGKNEGP